MHTIFGLGKFQYSILVHNSISTTFWFHKESGIVFVFLMFQNVKQTTNKNDKNDLRNDLEFPRGITFVRIWNIGVLKCKQKTRDILSCCVIYMFVFVGSMIYGWENRCVTVLLLPNAIFVCTQHVGA